MANPFDHQAASEKSKGHLGKWPFYIGSGVELGLGLPITKATPDGWLFSKKLAPQVGLEPTTLRLTAECSAIELLRNERAQSRIMR